MPTPHRRITQDEDPGLPANWPASEHPLPE
jgi:hypothetical protein